MKKLKLISLSFVFFANISIISGMGSGMGMQEEDLSAEIAAIEAACQKAKETKKSEEKENKEKEENKKLIKAVNMGKIIEAENAIKNGANVNAPDTTGAKWTPLMIASLRGNFQIAKLLIENGADVNASNAYGDTPLYLAANTSFELAKLLLEKGANVNGSYNNSLTPLMRAVIDGKLETVKLLLANGADPKFVNKDRRDAYSYAKDPQIKQLLNSERFEMEKSGLIKPEEPKQITPKQQEQKEEEDLLAQIMKIEEACAKSQKAQTSTVSQKPESIKPEPAKSQPVSARSEEAKVNREEAENFGSEIEAIELAHQKEQEKIREAQRLISAQEEKERNERLEQARLTGAAVQKDIKPEVSSTPFSLSLELPAIQRSPEAQPRIRQEEKKQEAERQQASEPSSGIVIEGGEGQ